MGGGFIFPPAIGFIIEGASINFFALVVTPLLFLSIIFFYVWLYSMEKTEIHLKFNELGRSTSIQFYGIRYQVKFDPRTKVIIPP